MILVWRACLAVALGAAVVALSACGTADRTDAQRSSMGPAAAGTAAPGGAAGAGAAIPGGASPASTQSTVGPSGLPPAPVAPGMAAGSFKPRADLDPNAMFDWPESASGSAASCQAGVYTGTFECSFVPDPTSFGSDIGTIDVSGPISLTLVQSIDGEFLEISDGSLDAVAQLFFGLQAKLHGQLDCGSGALMASGDDGSWALGDPSMPLLPGGTLGVALTGALDAQTGEITGQWSILSGTVPGTCTGTWSAMYMP